MKTFGASTSYNTWLQSLPITFLALCGRSCSSSLSSLHAFSMHLMASYGTSVIHFSVYRSDNFQVFHVRNRIRARGPPPAQFRQAVHRVTECFPLTKERERPFGTTGILHRRKQMVCGGFQRMKCARAKDDLSRIQKESKIRSRISAAFSAPVNGSSSCRELGKGVQTRTRTSPPNQFGGGQPKLGSNGAVLRLADTRLTTTRQQTFKLFKVIPGGRL